MRTLLIIVSFVLAPISLASDCELALNNLVKILSDKGALAAGKNIYPKQIDRTEFINSCNTHFKGTNYTLYLHRDNVSIVVGIIDDGSSPSTLKGPFFSAYRK